MHKGMTVVLACVLMWGGSALARQDGSENTHSKAGGKAVEHMSEHGLENTNAQWSDGAAIADERSGLRHQVSRGNGGSETDGRRNHGKDKHEGGGHGTDKGDKGHKDKKNHESHKTDKAHKGHKKADKEYR